LKNFGEFSRLVGRVGQMSGYPKKGNFIVFCDSNVPQMQFENGQAEFFPIPPKATRFGPISGFL